MTLEITRSRILAFRRRVGALDERLPPGPGSLRHAAWAGLQDSMPRAALLSIHARVAGTEAATWEDPSLVQLWGPRYSVFVVAACDHHVFSLGVLPDDVKGRHRAEDTAARLAAVLDGARMPYAAAGRALGVHHNSLRYAAPTGTVLIRWEGARGLLVDGEITGTWRRADTNVTVQPWRRLSRAERDAVAAEAESLPLPGTDGRRITVRWDDG